MEALCTKRCVRCVIWLSLSWMPERRALVQKRPVTKLYIFTNAHKENRRRWDNYTSVVVRTTKAVIHSTALRWIGHMDSTSTKKSTLLLSHSVTLTVVRKPSAGWTTVGGFYLLREIDATIMIPSMFCFSVPRESPMEDESHGGSQCVA